MSRLGIARVIGSSGRDFKERLGIFATLRLRVRSGLNDEACYRVHFVLLHLMNFKSFPNLKSIARSQIVTRGLLPSLAHVIQTYICQIAKMQKKMFCLTEIESLLAELGVRRGRRQDFGSYISSRNSYLVDMYEAFCCNCN